MVLKYVPITTPSALRPIFVLYNIYKKPCNMFVSHFLQVNLCSSGFQCSVILKDVIDIDLQKFYLNMMLCHITKVCARTCRTELCRFSGAKIYPGKGIRFVRSDSQVSSLLY